MLCQQAGVQEAGREQSRGSWPDLAKGVFHGTSCPEYKQGGVGQEARIAALALVSRWWASALCITGFFPSPPTPLPVGWGGESGKKAERVGWDKKNFVTKVKYNTNNNNNEM